MDAITRHKIGIAASPEQPALILFYTRGTSGLRKRIMPVRRLEEDGLEGAARRLVAAHSPFLDAEAVSFEQVMRLVTELQRRLAKQPPKAP